MAGWHLRAEMTTGENTDSVMLNLGPECVLTWGQAFFALFIFFFFSCALNEFELVS